MKRNLVEIAFEITYLCNLRCTHCYNKEFVKKPQPEMSTEQIFKALKKIRDFGAYKLKIGGGEPFMRKDFFDVYDYSVSLGYETNFSSNGLIVKKNIENMLERNIDKIQISLDNIGEKHDKFRNFEGLFEIVKGSISELNKNGIKINIATTLTKDNYNDLEQILDFCRDNDIFRWKIMKYIPDSCSDKLLLSKEDYKEAVLRLLDYKEECDISPEIIVAREFDMIKVPCDYNDMQCFGGKSFLSLKPNGDVTPCSYTYDIVCGNITEDSVEDIWNSEKMLEFSKDYYDCECQYADKCKGGCKAVSHFMKKEFDCDPYCWVK
ncbi:MAG: radical SAM protein [Nanoarchaeota archaeon]|nr:radical SAM protein [Nanoarchaeota archaeon]MCG2718310.1 radical SAM protein [Nanoarchaeota archaeon]